jgi:hypothetical protein
MKKINHRYTGLFLFLALLLSMGCKVNQNQRSSLEEEATRGGVALIDLQILDAEGLFNSNSSSTISSDQNPNLQYIAMESRGKAGINGTRSDNVSPKDFYTDVYPGKDVIWFGDIEKSAEKKKYKIKILQIELANPNCIFEDPRIRGNSGNVQARVKEDAEDNCEARYTIWFELENKAGDTRAFSMDPFLRAKR